MQWSEEEALEPESLSCCHISSIIHSFNKHLLSTAYCNASKSAQALFCGTYVPVGRYTVTNTQAKGKRQTAVSVQRMSRADLRPGVVRVHSPCQPSTSLSASSHSAL